MIGTPRTVLGIPGPLEPPTGSGLPVGSTGVVGPVGVWPGAPVAGVVRMVTARETVRGGVAVAFAVGGAVRGSDGVRTGGAARGTEPIGAIGRCGRSG
jgi:hypothetical protein